MAFPHLRSRPLALAAVPRAAQPAHQTDLPLSDVIGRGGDLKAEFGRSGGGGRSSAADERQSRRKATRWEDRGPVSSPQLLRRLSVGGDEGAVSFTESETDLPRRGVDERSVRLLRAVGPLVLVLLENR